MCILDWLIRTIGRVFALLVLEDPPPGYPGEHEALEEEALIERVESIREEKGSK